MMLPDINILIDAHNTRAEHHQKSLQWWNQCLASSEGIALAWVVVLGFVRICTNPKVFERPMQVEDAVGRIEEWLALPHIQLVHPAQTHFATWSSLLKGAGTAGHLTTDAHLAALAMERGLILQTTDADFARFQGLKWENPLQKN